MDTITVPESRTPGAAGVPWDGDRRPSDDEPRPSLDEIARALHARAIARAESWRRGSEPPH